MHEIDKLAWVHIRDKRLLGARSKGKNHYYIPGGKREQHKTDHAALMREIKEELSVQLIPETIKYLGQFRDQADEKPAGQMVSLTCYGAEYAGSLQAAAEIEEITWLSYRDRERCSQVTKIIMDWLFSKNIIE